MTYSILLHRCNVCFPLFQTQSLLFLRRTRIPVGEQPFSRTCETRVVATGQMKQQDNSIFFFQILQDMIKKILITTRETCS